MLKSRLFTCLELATFLTRAKKLWPPTHLILFPSQLFVCLLGKAERSVRNLHFGRKLWSVYRPSAQHVNKISLGFVTFASVFHFRRTISMSLVPSAVTWRRLKHKFRFSFISYALKIAAEHSVSCLSGIVLLLLIPTESSSFRLKSMN